MYHTKNYGDLGGCYPPWPITPSSISKIFRWYSASPNNCYYYPFQIFLPFWLAKMTCIIYHKQLPLTKFGKILPYWTNDVKSAAKLKVNELLTKRTWGWAWVVLEVSNGGGTFYLFHGELLSKNIARTAERQLDGGYLIFRVYLQTWTALYVLNFLIKMHYWYELNIDRGKHVLACFETWNYFEWIITQLLNSAFVGYEELCRSRRVLSTSALPDLHNSSYPSESHSVIAKYNNIILQNILPSTKKD